MTDNYGFYAPEDDFITTRITMPCECKLEAINVPINETIKVGDVILVSYKIIRGGEEQ